MSKKQRLDHRVSEMMPQYSKRQIQSWIMQGKVTVDKQIITKPGHQVGPDASISVDAQVPKYVSRAGVKLEKALEHFHIDVSGLVALDAGISTGGFTDCLLQHGVRKVYGIDVGYGQVHEKIQHNDHVEILERTNLRTLESVGELVDLVTLDLSFISVLKVMDAVTKILKPDGKLIVLIKPQFEAERHEVGKGGIIKDPAIHQKVIDCVVAGIQSHGFSLEGITESPILGGEGNKEFLAYFTRK